MSAQLLELLIFGGVAIFVITKLISILGTTSEDDPARKNQGRNGFFGEPTRSSSKTIKSVATDPSGPVSITKKLRKKTNLKGLVVNAHKDEVLSGLKDIQEKLPNFDLSNFVKGSKVAFKMIIDSANTEDEEELNELVDKRYVEHFKEIAPSYGDVNGSNEVKAEISEIYTFGNNVFVKVLFVGKNITEKMESFHEEWTFSKNALTKGPEWHLTNIDRPQ